MITLGYWYVRALGDPIRFLLIDNEIAFQDKQYKTPDEWFGKDKQSLGLDFPNLPYLIDGDVKLTQVSLMKSFSIHTFLIVVCLLQTLAILRYLGRKYGLSGKNEQEIRRLDLLEQEAFDLMMTLIRTWYADKSNYDEKVRMLRENLPQRLQNLAKFLDEKCFILENRNTYVDYLLYVVLDYIRLYQSDLYGVEAKLKCFMNRLESKPLIKNYINNPDFQTQPITAPFAMWGGSRK